MLRNSQYILTPKALLKVRRREDRLRQFRLVPKRRLHRFGAGDRPLYGLSTGAQRSTLPPVQRGVSSMNVLRLRWRGLILAVVACLACRVFVVASDESTLTKDQIKQFLLTAKVVKSVHSKKGITNPWRLTLTDGTVTHDASFQAVDEHKARMETLRGVELGFVDSYKYNIAAYQLSELLGIA